VDGPWSLSRRPSFWSTLSFLDFRPSETLAWGPPVLAWGLGTPGWKTNEKKLLSRVKNA